MAETKKSNEVRRIYVQLRVTEKEYKALKRAAEAAGLTVSELVRRLGAPYMNEDTKNRET